MSSAASIRARLLNVARERGVDFNLLLVTYGLQRVLYRLSLSAPADQFVLKGAQLLQQLLPGIGFRPTRDADLTSAVGLGEEAIRRLFRSAMEAEAEDGLVFDADSLKVEGLRGQTEMGGLQVSLLAYLAGARIPVRVDVSVSDAMVPDPVDVEFRTLLDMPAPRLKGYAIETVIAEKARYVDTESHPTPPPGEGGRKPMEKVAGKPRNRRPDTHGISGRITVEYAIIRVRAGGSDSEAFRRWFTLVTPSRIASRTRPVWQYQNVPSLSRLLPPNQSIPTSQAASSFTQSAATN